MQSTILYIYPKLLTTKFVPIIMFHMLSELPLLSKVGADIVVEHDNVNNFLNLFENVSSLWQFLDLTDSRRPPAELKVANELSTQNPVGTLYALC